VNVRKNYSARNIKKKLLAKYLIAKCGLLLHISGLMILLPNKVTVLIPSIL